MGAFGDSPMRQKFAMWPGQAAFLACGYCMFQGGHPAGATGPGHGMYFRGYDIPVAQTMLFDSEPMLVGDPRLQLDHDRHMERAYSMHGFAVGAVNEVHKEAAVAPAHLHALAKAQAKYHGCKGISVIPKALSYVDYKTFWVLPLAHAFLYGVLANFWNLLLPKQTGPVKWYAIKKEGRKLIASRGHDLVATSEYSHAYQSILDKRGVYIMDEWLHFMLTWSVYLVRDGKGVLQAEVMELWTLLRIAGVHYFVKGPAGSFTEEARQEGLAALVLFSRKIDALVAAGRLPIQLMTYNLHILVCRLYEQETARGHTANDLEMWVERLIQRLKESTKYRMSWGPERLATNTIIFDYGLGDVYATGQVKGFEDLKYAGYGEGKVGRDDGGEDGCQLLGPGKCARDSDKSYNLECCQHLLRRLILDFPEEFEDLNEGELMEKVVPGSICKHTRANRGGCEILTSKMYKQDQARCNHFITLMYPGKEGRAAERWIGKIQFFFRADLMKGDQQVRVRVAACMLWKAHITHACLHEDLMHVITEEPGHDGCMYPVSLDTIECKLVGAFPIQKAVHQDFGRWYFMRPRNVSRRL